MSVVLYNNDNEITFYKFVDRKEFALTKTVPAFNLINPLN